MKFKNITGFIRGLFAKEGDEGRIPDGFLLKAHNVDIDNTGRIERRLGYEDWVDWESFPADKTRIQNIFYFSSVAGNKSIGVILGGRLYLQVLDNGDRFWLDVPFYDDVSTFGEPEKLNISAYLDSIIFNRPDDKVFFFDGSDLITQNTQSRIIYFSGNKIILKDTQFLETREEIEVSSTTTSYIGKSVYEGMVLAGYIPTETTEAGLRMSYSLTYVDNLGERFYLVIDNPTCEAIDRVTDKPYILKFNSSFVLVDFTSLEFSAGASSTNIFGFGMDSEEGVVYIHCKDDQITKIDIENLFVTPVNTGAILPYLAGSAQIDRNGSRWYSCGYGDGLIGIYSTHKQTTEDEIVIDRTNLNAVARTAPTYNSNESTFMCARSSAEGTDLVTITDKGNICYLFDDQINNRYQLNRRQILGDDFTIPGDPLDGAGNPDVRAMYYKLGGSDFYISWNNNRNSGTDKRGNLLIINRNGTVKYNGPCLPSVGAQPDEELYISKIVRDYRNDKLYAIYNRSVDTGSNTTGHYISDITTAGAMVSHELIHTPSAGAISPLSRDSEVFAITTYHDGDGDDFSIVGFRNFTNVTEFGRRRDFVDTYLCGFSIDPFSNANVLGTPTLARNNSAGRYSRAPIDVEFANDIGYLFDGQGLETQEIVDFSKGDGSFVIDIDSQQFNGEPMPPRMRYFRLEDLDVSEFVAVGRPVRDIYNREILVIDKTNDRADLHDISNPAMGDSFGFNRVLELSYESRKSIEQSRCKYSLYQNSIVETKFFTVVPFFTEGVYDGQQEYLPFVIDLTFQRPPNFGTEKVMFFKRFNADGTWAEAQTYVVATDKTFLKATPIYYDSSEFINVARTSPIWKFGMQLDDFMRYAIYASLEDDRFNLTSMDTRYKIGYDIDPQTYFSQKIQNDGRFIFFIKDKNGFTVRIGDSYSAGRSYLVNRSSTDEFVPGFNNNLSNFVRGQISTDVPLQSNEFLSIKLLGAAKSPVAEAKLGLKPGGDQLYANYQYRYYLVYVLISGKTSAISGKPQPVLTTDVSGTSTAVSTVGADNKLTTVGGLPDGTAIGFISGVDPIPVGLEGGVTYFVVQSAGNEFKVAQIADGDEVQFEDDAADFLFYNALQDLQIEITQINELDRRGVAIYERDDILRIDLYRSEQPVGGEEGRKNFVVSLEKDDNDEWYFDPSPGSQPYAAETYVDGVRNLPENIPDANLYEDYICKDTTVHKNRIILGNIQSVSGNNIIQYSDINLSQSFAADQVRAIQSGDGDEIQSIYSLGDYLYIFKFTKIYAIYGDAPTGSLIDVSRNVGAPFRNMITVFDNKIIYFLNEYGIHAIAGTNYVFLSGDSLSNFFDPNREDSIDFANINANGFTYVDNEKREIHFYVPKKSNGISQLFNNFVIIYNVEQKSFRTYSYAVPISSRTDIMDIENNEKKTLIGTYDGDIYQMSINRTDNGEPIYYRILTSEFFISSNFTNKRFKLIKVFGKYLKDLRIFYYIDGERYDGNISLRSTRDGKGEATHFPRTNGVSSRIAIGIEGEAKNDSPIAIEEILMGYTDLKGSIR